MTEAGRFIPKPHPWLAQRLKPSTSSRRRSPRTFTRPPVLVGLALLALLAPRSAAAETAAFRVESNLRAGVAKVDITPETPLRVTGHVREVSGVRDPIRAAVLLLDDGQTRAAIVTLDLIGAWEDMVEAIRENLNQVTEIPADHIMVAASHNHSGPSYREHPEWAEQALAQITQAARDAAADMRSVNIGYGEDEIDFAINRRQVINGKAVVRLNPDGPNDPRVRVLRFDDGRSLTPLAVMMHAVCHPCFFTWGDNFSPPYPQGFPQVSADFPGEAQAFIEQAYGGRTQSLFLQGCAGDIRPNLPGHPYRCADEADIQWAGRSLGGAVVRTLAREVIRERLAQREKVYPLRCLTTKIQLPGKEGLVRAELMAMKIGPYLLLTMPGEPMVEYGFELEKRIADRAIPIVVGYANGNIGYICTAESHQYGGYEPNVSKLAPEAEAMLLDELEQLADAVIGDVFESFSKHPTR
jgi:neutral ceramidase